MATKPQPNQAEVLFTIGEVQDNHARNIAGVLRVAGEVQVISLNELPNTMPTIDIPYPHDRSGEFDYVQDEKYEFERASWLRDYLRDTGHGNVAQANMNLVYEDGLISVEAKRHWTNLIGILPQKSYDSMHGLRPVPVRGWRYTPFMINDTRITGDAPKIDSILDMGPVSYTLATAHYESGRPYGAPTETSPANVIDIVFDYPTRATIKKTTKETPYKKNDDGDYITFRVQTEVAKRAYYPAVPEHLRAEIDRIRSEYDEMAHDAYEKDSFMYEMGGDMGIDISKSQELAPLYNLI